MLCLADRKVRARDPSRARSESCDLRWEAQAISSVSTRISAKDAGLQAGMRIANTGHMSPHSHHPLRRQIFGVADDRRVSTYEDAIPPDYSSSTSQPPSPQADAQEVGGRSPALPPQVRIVLEDLVIDVGAASS